MLLKQQSREKRKEDVGRNLSFQKRFSSEFLDSASMFALCTSLTFFLFLKSFCDKKYFRLNYS